MAASTPANPPPTTKNFVISAIFFNQTSPMQSNATDRSNIYQPLQTAIAIRFIIAVLFKAKLRAMVTDDKNYRLNDFDSKPMK
jgi:hypothetical protein